MFSDNQILVSMSITYQKALAGLIRKPMSINIKQELWVHADPPATENVEQNHQVNPSGKKTFIHPELPKK